MACTSAGAETANSLRRSFVVVLVLAVLVTLVLAVLVTLIVAVLVLAMLVGVIITVRVISVDRLEFHFVSHGPGCDDVSIYRPFWRIDLDLDGPENDQVWLFEETQWMEAVEEFETFPLVRDLSPEDHKLATFDGDTHYRWSMERTDPLGLDEGYLFLLQWRLPIEIRRISFRVAIPVFVTMSINSLRIINLITL